MLALLGKLPFRNLELPLWLKDSSTRLGLTFSSEAAFNLMNYAVWTSCSSITQFETLASHKSTLSQPLSRPALRSPISDVQQTTQGRTLEKTKDSPSKSVLQHTSRRNGSVCRRIVSSMVNFVCLMTRMQIDPSIAWKWTHDP